MEINDVIYGTFKIPLDVAAIVKTPQFQRLKSIKQLSFLTIDNVVKKVQYRYDHCLGTYYAACQMLNALEKNSTWLSDNNNKINVTELAGVESENEYKNKIPLVYRSAVQLAALLHDVGHGPFSHAWEHVVESYIHEIVAFRCIDEIFEQISSDLFPELRCNNNYGIDLIKSLIEGDRTNFKRELPQYFQFIFEIVSNKQTKLDVDKWDYLKRDYYYLSSISAPNIDFDDVFLRSKVSACGTHIEYCYDDFAKIYNIFAARYDFHLNCYLLPQHILKDYILNLAIKKVKPKINNLLLTEIDSNRMLEFLQLTDTNVLELLKDSEWSKFLENDAKYIKVNELNHMVDRCLYRRGYKS